MGDADVGVGQHHLGSLDVVVGKFWRTTSRPACAASSSKTRLGALADQAARELERVMQGRAVGDRTRHLLGENLGAPCFSQRVAPQGKVLVYGTDREAPAPPMSIQTDLRMQRSGPLRNRRNGQALNLGQIEAEMLSQQSTQSRTVRQFHRG